MIDAMDMDVGSTDYHTLSALLIVGRDQCVGIVLAYLNALQQRWLGSDMRCI